MIPHTEPRTGSAARASTVMAMVGLQWRRLRRDPVGLVFTLVMPVAVALVLGTIYMAEAAGPARVGVVAETADPVSGDLAARLGDNPALDVRVYPHRAALDRAVRRRVVEAGIVVPAALGPDLGGEVELVGPPDVAAPAGIRAAVEASAAETTAAVQLGAALAPDGPLEAGLAAARSRLAERAGGDGGADAATKPGDSDAERDGDERRDAAGAAVMATLVLFVFMNTAAGASAWPEARELGVVGRLRSTASSPRAVAAGFGLGSASFAAVQGAIVLGVGAVLFDLPLRSPGAVAAVLAAAGLAAGGVAVLVATVLPSSGSGVTVAGPLAFVLAMLGGCLWPLEIVPDWLAAAGRATPQLWAVEGLQAGAIGGDGLAAVLGGVASLVAIGAVAGAVGGRRMARNAGAV